MRDVNKQLTSKLLRVSSSSNGDYHNNMNSEMYTKKVDCRKISADIRMDAPGEENAIDPRQ